MQNKNSIGYLRLAMLRTEKLYSLSVDANNEKLSPNWLTNNEDLVRIEKGIVTSLGKIKEEGRSTLYSDMTNMRENAVYEMYRIASIKYKSPSDFESMAKATKIKDATDFMELVLQLNYPQEFPNPLVDEILSYLNKDSKLQPAGQNHTSMEYEQVLKTISTNSGIEEMPEEMPLDLSDVYPQAQADNSTDFLNNDTYNSMDQEQE